MIRTFIDAGVLIAAARGKGELASRALSVLKEPNREFASSILLKLEVLPKALYYKNQLEIDFYEEFFQNVAHWADSSDQIIQMAYKEATENGLAAMDSLHIAAAILVGATELITIERPEKPIHRTKSLKVISIWMDESI